MVQTGNITPPFTKTAVAAQAQFDMTQMILMLLAGQAGAGGGDEEPVPAAAAQAQQKALKRRLSGMAMEAKLLSKKDTRHFVRSAAGAGGARSGSGARGIGARKT